MDVRDFLVYLVRDGGLYIAAVRFFNSFWKICLDIHRLFKSKI